MGFITVIEFLTCWLPPGLQRPVNGVLAAAFLIVIVKLIIAVVDILVKVIDLFKPL